MRKLIIVGIGILLLAGSVFVSNLMSKKNEPKAREVVKELPLAQINEVKNSTLPVQLTTTGQVIAKNRVDLFAEVQGIMITGARQFKPGVSFAKGEVLLKVKSDDFRASVMAQKSNFLNLLTGALADIRLDFPNEFDKWESYVSDLDLEKNLSPLPKTNSDQEKFFITSRNILSTYYSIKNLEITLDKYTIRAPFNGTLTEALVNPGTIIRPGQKLGEFINPGEYELELAVSSNLAPFVKKEKWLRYDLLMVQAAVGKAPLFG